MATPLATNGGQNMKRVLTGGLVLLGLVLLAFYYAPHQDPSDGEPFVIRQGEIRIVGCDNPSLVLKDWETVTLPYWAQHTQTPMKCYQFRTEVSQDKLFHDSRPDKLMFYNIGNISRIHFNGQLIEDIRQSTKTVYINAHRPHEIYLPSNVRWNTNELLFEGITYQPFIHVGVVLIGTDPDIAQLYKVTTFLVVTMFDGIKILCLMLGFLFVAFRILFPRERLIGLAGGTMLLWGLYYGLVNIVGYPIAYHLPIQVTQLAAAALFCFSFADFTMEIAGFQKSRIHLPLRIIGGLIGPLAILYFKNQTILVWLNTYWLFGLVLYFNIMLFYCAVYGGLLKKSEGRVLMVQAMVMLVTVAHDYCALNGLMGPVRAYLSSPVWPDLLFENYYLTLYGIMLVVFVKSSIVINYYRINRNYTQNEAVRVAFALRQSEARLREVLQKQHDIHNIKLIQSERERLLMEIHDGVGSQLISGMLLAKKEGLQKQTVLDMIQGCIDDVRVIIDCISLAERANALEIFKKLLDRQRPRLAGLGITLHYHPETRFSDQSEISDAQCLHASRIIQECIANAIKHATCTTIVVAVRQYRDHLLIVVSDDGGGVADSDLMHLGRGLKNMRKRSRLLGGRIKFQNRGGGFAVILRFRNRSLDTPDGVSDQGPR